MLEQLAWNISYGLCCISLVPTRGKGVYTANMISGCLSLPSERDVSLQRMTSGRNSSRHLRRRYVTDSVLGGRDKKLL